MLDKTPDTDQAQKNSMNKDNFVRWFRDVAPYVHTHRGSTMVVHLSGELLLSNALQNTVHDIALLNSLGIKLVLTFGGRPQIEQTLSEHKIDSHYVEGLRITDQASLEIIQQVVGSLQLKLLGMLSMKLPNSPMAGARIQVTSGNYVTARPAGVVAGTDLQFTGRVRNVDAASINSQIDEGNIVVVPPIGYSITGDVFDLSALELATQLAIELQANKLLFLLPYAGLTDAAGNVLRQMTQQEAETIFNASSDQTCSPHAELYHAIQACQNSVERVHLIDHRTEGGLLQELFSRDGVGTLISQMPFDTIRPATSDDIPGILRLIEPLEQQGVIASRSQEHIELQLDDFLVMVRDGTVIACGALHDISDGPIAELACLVVHEDYQQQQKGLALFSKLEQRAINQQIKELFVLTTQAEHWFIERGFTQCPFTDLPAARQQQYNSVRNSKIFAKRY